MADQGLCQVALQGGEVIAPLRVSAGNEAGCCIAKYAQAVIDHQSVGLGLA